MRKRPETRSLFGAPTTKSHTLFNGRPNTLDHLAVSPAPTALDAILLIPALNRKVVHTASPTLDLAGNLLAAPTDVYTGGMLEQLRRGRPLVWLELPCLTGGEDSDKAVPVIGLEVGRAIEDDELGGTGGLAAGARTNGVGIGVGRVAVDAEWALKHDTVGVCCAGEGGVIRWDENTLFEECFDVRHADERGGGGRDQDDRVGTRARAGLA